METADAVQVLGFLLPDKFTFPGLRHLQVLYSNLLEIHIVDGITAPNLQSLSVNIPVYFGEKPASIGDITPR